MYKSVFINLRPRFLESVVLKMLFNVNIRSVLENINSVTEEKHMCGNPSKNNENAHFGLFFEYNGNIYK